MVGHFLGGSTAIGTILKDKRIRAVLMFSAPAYPFEDSVDKINIATMFMVGDNDEPGLGPDVPRKNLLSKSPTPKILSSARKR